MSPRRPSILVRALRSTGLATSLLLIILWVVSESGDVFGYFSPRGSTFVMDGHICQPFHDRLPASLSFASGWCLLDRDAAPARSDLSIPLWLPLLLVATPTFLIWRQGRGMLPSPVRRAVHRDRAQRPRCQLGPPRGDAWRRARMRRFQLAGMALCGLLVVAWPLSFFAGCSYGASWKHFGMTLVLRCGEAVVFADRTPLSHPFEGWRSFRPGNAGGWLPTLPGINLEADISDQGTFLPGRDITLFIPVWCLLGCAVLLTLLFAQRGRRLAESHCPTCGYNLTGNASGVCPECGLALGKQSQHASLADQWERSP